jgi:hypothetical protein
MLAGADGGGCCMRQEAVTFPFFGASLSEPAAVDGRFGAVNFLLTGGTVGLACSTTCTAGWWCGVDVGVIYI